MLNNMIASEKKIGSIKKETKQQNKEERKHERVKKKREFKCESIEENFLKTKDRGFKKILKK